MSREGATTLAGCPLPIVAATVLARLEHEPIPDDVDPAWADLVTAIYTNAWPGRAATYLLPRRVRHDLVATVTGAGGHATAAELHAVGFVHTQLVAATEDNYGSFGMTRSLERDNADRAWLPYTTVSLIGCPHCDGTAAQVVAVPETKRAHEVLGGAPWPSVLCRNCGRLPVSESPVFPSAYLDLDGLTPIGKVPPGRPRSRDTHENRTKSRVYLQAQPRPA